MRFLLQTSAVLAGILIAFGLDAGYSVVRERAELRESLGLLQAEFSGARVQMDTVLKVNERALEAMEAFSTLEPQEMLGLCLLYTSPSPRDQRGSRMPSSA